MKVRFQEFGPRERSTFSSFAVTMNEDVREHSRTKIGNTGTLRTNKFILVTRISEWDGFCIAQWKL